jgi:hypothetical protein
LLKSIFPKKNVKTFSSLINIAIYFRATIAVIQRLISKWSLAILDFAFFTGLIYGLAIVYQQVTKVTFPFETIKFIIPIYGLIWTISNQTFGNHYPPLNFSKLLKANFIGLLFLLSCYALVPKSIQFSRVVILSSSLVTLLLSFLTRYTFKILNIGLFKNYQPIKTKVAIIGSIEEINRLNEIFIKSHKKIEKTFKINPNKSENRELNYDGNINQINEFININKIDEVIFCAQDISAQDIIYSMANVDTKKNIDFKIIPEKSQFIIGSQSIYSDENYFATELKHINSIENTRKKRIFDLYASIILIIFSPLLLPFLKNYTLVFKQIINVIVGKKTWIGYEESKLNTNLPAIKPSVFSVLNYRDKENADILHKLNIIYAKDYSLLLDLNLLLKRIFNFH